MAIAIDVASLGHAATTASTTTAAFTTGAAVAAGGFIVLGVGWFLETATLSSVSGGSLSWSIDKQGVNPGGPAQSVAVVSAQAPAGLASGTTITATFSANADAKIIGGCSFTGVATSSPVDGTPPAAQGQTAASTWTTSAQTLAAGSVMVCMSWDEGTVTSATVTAPASKAWDHFDATDGYGSVFGYQIVPGGGSTTIAGTWNAATNSATCSVAYLEAAGTPPVTNEAALRTAHTPVTWRT